MWPARYTSLTFILPPPPGHREGLENAPTCPTLDEPLFIHWSLSCSGSCCELFHCSEPGELEANYLACGVWLPCAGVVGEETPG